MTTEGNGAGVNSASKKRTLVLIVLGSFGVALFNSVLENGWNFSIYRIAEMFGAMLGLLLIPLAVLVFTKGTGTGAGITFVVIASLMGLGGWTQYQDKHRTSVVRLKGCDFTIEFPGKPKIKTFSHPELSDYEEGMWVSDLAGVALKSECVLVPNMSEKFNGVDIKGYLIQTLSQYAQGNGMSGASYEYDEGAAWPTAILRGNKMIDGKPTTYLVKVILGKTSILTLTGGGLASSFPQDEINPFLRSAKLAR